MSLLGCVAESSTLLPTATLIPTQLIPTNTPTPLPPATVTPYPTITPHAPGESVNEGDATTSATEDSQPTGVAQSPSETATQAVAASAGGQGNIHEGLNLGQVEFSADFARGWPTVDEPTAKIEIVNGQYAFAIGPFDARFFNTSSIDASDFYAQVDTQIVQCTEGGVYGLLVRQSDPGNYYAFVLFCNNTYSVTARVNGSLLASPLAAGSLPGTDAIGAHSLGVLAQGGNLTFYLDGQELTSISDQRHTQGDVALYAASQSSNIMEVAFDNLKVWSLR